MSTTLQSIIVVVAVAALSLVAVDSLNVWDWEKFAQNNEPVNKHVADKNVYASDVDEEKLGIISVKGSATTSVDPDIFTVKLGVRIQDENAGAALSLNSQIMENVIAAVMDAGIDKDELSTSSLKVYPVYGDYDYEKNAAPLIGYRAENIVLVETTKLDFATSIIDRASEAGANQIDKLNFKLSPELRKEVTDSLLQDAVLDAKNRANEALEPLNKSVSDVKTVNLSPAPAVRYGGFTLDSATVTTPSFSSAPILSSSEDVKVSIEVVFTIQ